MSPGTHSTPRRSTANILKILFLLKFLSQETAKTVRKTAPPPFSSLIPIISLRFNFAKRRRRLKNVTVTLRREVTRIKRIKEARSVSQSSIRSFHPESLVWEVDEEQEYADLKTVKF